MSFQVVIYYNFLPIQNPAEMKKEQEILCKSLNLKGRVLLGDEGINGTLEGSTENIETYCQTLAQNEYFKDVLFKKTESGSDSFPKLKIKLREEIVARKLGEFDVKPWVKTGKYLSVDELHNWFLEKKEFYIVDMRNDYEHQVGHFQDSILPKELKHFRDLPKVISSIEHLKNKTIVTVCTYGIRCEIASGFLLKHGFCDVYQLKDGIGTYMAKYPNQHFKGKLYVFDNRMAIGFHTNSKDHEIVGKCQLCGIQSENYVNWLDENKIRKHDIICQKCITEKAIIFD